jgi:SAM-dependent methyltransferase
VEGTKLMSTKVADPTKNDLIEHDNSGPLARAQSWLSNAVSDAYNHPSKKMEEVGSVALVVATAALVIGTKGKGTEFINSARNFFDGARKLVRTAVECERELRCCIPASPAKTAAELIAEFKPGLTEIEQARMAQLEPELTEIGREWTRHEVRTRVPGIMGYAVSTDLPPPATGTFQASLMSAGDLRHYVHNLKIPPEELHEDWRILDLGSGARQNLARDCQHAKLRSTIFSLDPRLAMSDLEDVKIGLFRGVRGTNEPERLYGRRFPQPLTLAGDGTQLPFSDAAFQRVYAHYSLPMYLSEDGVVASSAQAQKIATSLAEIKRVLEPGGIARIFPIPDGQLPTVEKSLRELGLRPYPHNTPPTQWPNDTFRFGGHFPYDPDQHLYSYYHRGRYVGPPLERLLMFRT